MHRRWWRGAVVGMAIAQGGLSFAASAPSPAPVSMEGEEAGTSGFEKKIDGFFAKLNSAAGSVLFWDITSPFRTPPTAPDKPAGFTEAHEKDLAAYRKAHGIYERTLVGMDEGFPENPPVEPEFPASLKGALENYSQARLAYEDEQAEFGARSVPLLVLWLFCGALFMTVRMGFINLRGFKHAISVTRGKYDNPADAGEVSHFQALCSALSATVGLGNIAGVGIAIAMGGPGATFWMILAGFLGMSAKFVECTLGQKYRKVDANGVVSGGPMQYLHDGLREKGMAGFGKILAVLFAILCIGGSFGGGNTFQVNQSLRAIVEIEQFHWMKEYKWVYGLFMAVAVGIVIIGGIRRIASTAEKIVPIMCGIYVLAAMWIILSHADRVPACFAHIVAEAFSPRAALGGAIGVMVLGIKRSVFSNEAGVGSASIAHSAAKTEEPIREGIVALLEPFIDTILVCTMTGLVIVITGVYLDPANADLISGNNGAALTSRAFGEKITWFPLVLGLSVMLFAYSTMISWSYYGERCWSYLFGPGSSLIYRLIFITFTFLGSLVTATQILDFSDLMILSMAFPNLLGLYFMSSGVKKDLDSYLGKLRRGEFKTYH